MSIPDLSMFVCVAGSQPRRSVNRPILGVRWKWLKDRQCRSRGHIPDASTTQRQLGGAFWPICTRCGYAIEPERTT